MKFSDYDRFFRLTINSIYGIKTYKDFSIRASASFINSCNDKWELK